MPKPSENEFDIHAYRKFLMSHFPSQYLHNKIVSENENETQKDSALTSKKNRRKRHCPFVSEDPSSKRRKENMVDSGIDMTNVADDMYKYANIITTRSGKQIKIPAKIKSKDLKSQMHLNHELEMKSPKGGGKTAPLPGGKGASNTVSSATSSRTVSSKKESSFGMKTRIVSQIKVSF